MRDKILKAYRSVLLYCLNKIAGVILVMLAQDVETAIDDHGQPLICYGCFHSVGWYHQAGNDSPAPGAEFPGRPSGERPCHFCIRNPDRENMQSQYVMQYGHRLECWYDGAKPYRLPMDCYHSIDMKMQHSLRLDEVRKEQA